MWIGFLCGKIHLELSVMTLLLDSFKNLENVRQEKRKGRRKGRIKKIKRKEPWRRKPQTKEKEKEIEKDGKKYQVIHKRDHFPIGMTK